MVWMALAAGAISLASGYFSSQSAKKTAKKQQMAHAWAQIMQNEAAAEAQRSYEAKPVDIKQMMKDAEEAGFNPVTWLQAGAMQTYNRLGAVQLGMPQYSPSPVTHVPGNGEIFANAAGAAFNVYRDDLKTEQAQTFQKSLFGATMSGAQAGKKAGKGPSSFYVPATVTHGSASTNRNALGLSGGPTKPDVGDTTYTNPWSFFKVDPTIRDADAHSTRYGESELGETEVWLANKMGDFMYNATGLNRDQRWQRTKSWAGSVNEYFGGLVSPPQRPVFTQTPGLPSASW